jgi:DNA processing protein
MPIIRDRLGATRDGTSVHASPGFFVFGDGRLIGIELSADSLPRCAMCPPTRARSPPMTLDHAVALSLFTDLCRVGLAERLKADDPNLLELANTRLVEATAVRRDAETRGIGVLPWFDARFPTMLGAISDGPVVLWFRGDLSALDRPAVAIVGSRAGTVVALETAARLSADLAARGITVVSGLARGVDSAAHRGALKTGRTVAVLGSGLDHVYPREHRELARDIAVRGLVVSEYPPGTRPEKRFFPLRNRLISGLSRAVVIIEAAEDSGSLITAACALEQGRDVMAVPGTVLGGRNRGGHALIRDGAKIVECADDIVEDLSLGMGAITAPETGASACTAESSIDPVLRRMEAGQSYDLDALAYHSGLDVGRLLPRLMELELAGLIRRAEGGRFVRSA